jgi:AbrB family looped-hinge helix DNA binding protein
MTTATLTSKGQVTIPKDVRDKLGLKQGDRLLFTTQPDGSIRVRPRTAHIKDLYGILPKPKRPVSVEEMNEAIGEAVAELDRRTLSPGAPGEPAPPPQRSKRARARRA